MKNNIYKKRSKSWLTCFIIVFILSAAFGSLKISAAPISSTTQGGLWNSTATWAGGVIPGSADDVTIVNGAIVTVDIVASVKSLTIGQGASGILQWGASNNTITVSGNVLINSGASLLLYTSAPTAASMSVGGNFTNNGFANLVFGTLAFNGSQVAGGSLSQTLGGTGTFVGQGGSGIIRSLLFQTTGSSTISTSQNLITTLSFIHSAGSLNTNGKLTIDNTAQVYGQALNNQVANIVVSNMGTGYVTAPVVSANGAIKWPASTLVAIGNILVSGTNVYAVTAGGITSGSAPVHTTGAVTNGAATLLWVGNTGTIGNALIGTVVAGTQYFYGNNLYTALTGGAIDVVNPPVHSTPGQVVNSSTVQFLYVGPAAQVSVNHDATSQTLRSLAITNPGGGYISAPGLSILNTGAGSGATATVVYFQKIDGLGSATTQKSAIASISGGLTVNSTQGASAFSGVGGITASNGGLNYTVAPNVGFAGPTGINLVTAGGTGFTGAPTITVSGGTLISGIALATGNFTITVAGGKVVSVYLNASSTSVYSVPPTLSFTGGGGSGATLAFPAGCWPTATATLGTNRQVNNFTITNPGFGYIAAPNVGISGGTFTTAATGLTARIALYNLTYGFLAPAADNAIFNEGPEVPASRRFNAFTMNSSFGAKFTGNLELTAATPLTLTNGRVDFGSNTLTLVNAAYAGTAGGASSRITGVITLSSPGGSVTRTFPFERAVVVTTGTGTNASGSTITSLTVSTAAAATGTVAPGTNFPTGTRTYRLQTNGGVYGTSPSVTLNYGPEDALAADNPSLLIAKATSTSGPWTVVSATSGAGALTVPGSRVTNSFTGTGDDYLTFTTTFGACSGTPVAGTVPPVVGFCTTSSVVTVTLTGYTSNVSGITFAWEQSADDITFIPAVGTGVNTPVFTSPLISSTIYYRCVVTCPGNGSATSNSCKAGPVNCQYNVTRNTGITYNSIINSGSTYTSWTSTNDGDDEYTNAVPLTGTTFLYQGLPVSAFYATTNGFMSFNTALQNAGQANNLANASLTTQVLAPFWDDLTLRSVLSANHDNCMRYQVIGTLGSGTADIIIEWADMERFGFGPPNINFQVVLHEIDNSIDFNYGNFQFYDGSLNNSSLFSYSIGLNGSNPAGTSISDRMVLQRANQNFFSNTNQNTLSLTPECFTQLRFIPSAAYTGTDPGAPGIPVNDEAVNAIVVDANPTPCTVLCGNIYTSLNATASAGTTVCSAVTPGNPDDDVWFKFLTTAETTYKIDVTPSLNYDAVFQLLNASFVPITCINAAGIGLTESATVNNLTPNGATYYIRIYEAGAGVTNGHNGEFALCVSQLLAAPTNDECAAATSLTFTSVCTPTSSQLPATLAASASAGIPVCSAASPGNPDDDVWYSFTTNSSPGLTYNISVSGVSTYNAVLQLFSGTCGALTAITCVNATGNGGTETITTSSLNVNTTYRVRVYHAGNGAATGDFDVCVYVTPPPCAGGLSPANGIAIAPAGTTLSWTAVPIATGYNVYFSANQTDVTNESGAALVSTNQAGTTYATGALLPNTVYYWKVVTLSGVFVSSGCSVNNFNTSPPACVTITSPLNAASICYKTAFNLTWTASFGASGYDVYLDPGTGPATTLVSPNQPGTSYTITFGSLVAGQYSWRVEPKNFIGTNSTCANSSFTILIPPTVSATVDPVDPIICPGSSVTLQASGANSFTWSPATGLNTTTGANVIASPISTTTYVVTGEDVPGCGSTSSVLVTVNPVPSPPTTTGYLLCLNGTIPTGQGLIANCGAGIQINTVNFPLLNPSTNEGTVCPGNNTVASFTLPPIPVGATLISARIIINGITLGTNSWGTELRLSVSGSGIIGTSPCFQGASTTATPVVFNYVTGVPTLADSTTLKNLLNPAGGTIVIKYNESTDDIANGPDVTFPATGEFIYTISIPSTSSNWYDQSVGGNNLGSGSPFDPISAGVPINTAIPGTHTFYARCANTYCESTSTPVNLIIGQPLIANAGQASSGFICGGTPNQLSTIVTGGGTPYSYSWSPATGLNNSTISNPIATANATTTYTVTVTDPCGSTSTSSVTVNVTLAPNIQVTPTSGGSCVTSPSGFSLTASGGDTYTWSPATGLNQTVGASVLATPTTTTVYTVTGTSNSSSCTARATSTIIVTGPLTLSAAASPNSVCQNGTSQLNATTVSSAQNLLISEVTINRAGTGATATYPTFVTGADLVEITNVSSSPVDISGYTFGDYPSNSATANHPFTFPAGAIIPANSVLILCMGTGTNDVVNRYYNTGGASDSWTSGNAVGLVLKSGATIIDAVGLNTGYVFNAGTGVTSAHWSGFAPSAAVFAGTIRTASTDSNTGSDWTQSSTTLLQTIGTFNPGYILPPPPTFNYIWTPATFLSSTTISNPVATNVTGATNTYTVTATNAGGGCSSSATVTLTITPFASAAITSTPANPSICAGSTQALSSTVTGGSPPYTYSWAPATGLNTSTSSSVLATPLNTTTYTLTVTDNCGTVQVTTPVTITVNSIPTTSITGNPSNFAICGAGGSVNLTGNGATTYSWSPSTGLNFTTGTTVIASPIVTTIYTVVGTSSGCSSSATVSVSFSNAVTLAPTSNQNPGCSPMSTTINANAANPTGTAANYIFAPGSSATLNPMAGALIPIGSNVDDNVAPASSIGFNFNYEGVNFNSFSVSPDGWIKLGPSTGTIEAGNNVTSNTNLPKIYPYWEDMATGTSGNVKTLLTGSAPNRIFIVQWFVTIPRNVLGLANSTFQAWLYENGGKIEFRYGTMGSGAGITSSVGITGANSANFQSVTILSGTASNTTANNANAITPVSGTMYSFTPLPPSITYLWSPASNLSSVTSSSPQVTGLTSTTIFTVTATNNVGCSATSTITLTVNPSPAAPTISYPGFPNTAPLTFCVGGSILLDGTGPFNSYSWSSNGGTTIATTATFNATTSGTYSVAGTAANGCSSSSSVVVNVQSAPTPTITYPGWPNNQSSLSFCQGGNVVLNATGPYTEYSWSLNAGTTVLATTPTYAATAAGTYHVKVTANNNSCTATSSITVSVVPGPSAPSISAVGDTTLCNDGSTCVTLNATGLGSYDVLWNNADESTTPSINICGDDGTFIIFGDPYAFHVTITDPNTFCSATSNDIVVNTITCGSGVSLSSKVYIQGYYSGSGLMQWAGAGFLNVTGVSPDPTDVDTMWLSAMNPTFPYAEVDMKYGILKTNGNISVTFGPSVVPGNSYYIKINHRNSIETWSKFPVVMNTITTYLFNTAATQAYCDNMVNTPDLLHWAIYSGDFNQDGQIDGTDYLILDPAIQNGDGGFTQFDLNGDGQIDGTDYLILDPNIQNGVGLCIP